VRRVPPPPPHRAPKAVVRKNGVEKTPVDAAALGDGRVSGGGGQRYRIQNLVCLDFRFSPRCRRNLRYSGILRSVDW
jgi:hypothetical protein